MLETLRGEGAPPPACRAVVHAALRYVDAELLNALMLRRDACSISAVKALQVPLLQAVTPWCNAQEAWRARTALVCTEKILRDEHASFHIVACWCPPARFTQHHNHGAGPMQLTLHVCGFRVQSGLADIFAWVAYMGVGWCGEVEDARAALEHSAQATRYLLVGKDDCVRKATKARPLLQLVVVLKHTVGCLFCQGRSDILCPKMLRRMQYIPTIQPSCGLHCCRMSMLLFL